MNSTRKDERVLVLLSKAPLLGSSKTRLSASIGDEAACAFALAGLSDLLVNMSRVQCHRRILFFAPAEAHYDMTALLASLHCSDAWDAVPMSDGDLMTSDLGGKLQQGVTEARRSHSNASVCIIASDTIDLSPDDVNASFEHAPRAFLHPAQDGGYVLLTLPPHAPITVFDNVSWSTSSTLDSQITQLQRASLDVATGSVFRDIDEIQDLLWFAQWLRSLPPDRHSSFSHCLAFTRSYASLLS